MSKSTTLQTLLDKRGREAPSIQSDQTALQAGIEMDRLGCGGLIVKEGRAVVGIVTERDCVRRLIVREQCSAKEISVKAIMTTEMTIAAPDMTVESAIRMMKKNRCRLLPVINDDGTVAGLISIGDMLESIMAKQTTRIRLLEDFMFGYHGSSSRAS